MIFLLALFYINLAFSNPLVLSEDLVELSIVHVNDFHARFAEISTTGGNCNQPSECIGGFSRLYTQIQNLLSENPESILLNGGDNFQGTLYYSLGKWNITQQFMNMLPFDATVLGNHEFDDGVQGVVPFIKSLQTPVVCSNINDDEEPSMKGTYTKSVVIERHGKKIGIIGVIYSKTNTISDTGSLIFYQESASVNAEAERLVAEEGVFTNIVLSHVGYDIDKEIAANASEKIGLIVGAHSHTFLYTGDNPPGPDTPHGPYPTIVKSKNDKDVLIVQASCYSKYLGNITVSYNSDGEVNNYSGAPIFLEESLPKDTNVDEALKPWDDIVDAQGSVIIGSSMVTLSAQDCYVKECTLGNFVTDAFVFAHQSENQEKKRSLAELRGDAQTHSISIKQVRSASIDEIQLEAKRLQAKSNSQSKSELEIFSIDKQVRSVQGVKNTTPRRLLSSNKESVCIHCFFKEEYDRLHPLEETQVDLSEWLPYFDYLSSDEETDADICKTDVDKGESKHSYPAQEECQNTNYPRNNVGKDLSSSPHGSTSPVITLSTTSQKDEPPSSVIELSSPQAESVLLNPTQFRRKSIHRQGAFLVELNGNSIDICNASLENVSTNTSDDASFEGDVTSPSIPDLIVSDVYLQVPDLKRDRASSFDSCFTKVSEKISEELEFGTCLEVPINPNIGLRSKSVDIVLPTAAQIRYKALTISTPSTWRQRKSSGIKQLNGIPEWGPNATIGDHLWIATSLSGDLCYVGDSECLKVGNRFKCAACNIICHEQCMNILLNRNSLCKPSFKDVGVRQYREQTIIQHHWVHRRSEKGKCRHCFKSFQSKLSFSSKEIVAVSCSWCKAAFHNKVSCFNMQRIGENCDLGVHSSIIVPPSWIVKLPKKGSFKSSLKKVPQKRGPMKRKLSEKDHPSRTFVIKPIPSTKVTPVIVFINPKSGGNQGLKLLQKFQWLLNPRQVFDLTQGGPKFGLELFKKVPNLRVLACGGDGTVGWILSVLDQIQMNLAPPVGVLPLGTGNDLARALGWGGGYTDEPISKILINISQSDTVKLDRWFLNVEKNPTADQSSDGKDNLPLNVLNNYYSLGVDAHIALEFHEAREAHPEKFNSRLRNKMFYGQMGGKDLLLRKWKDLADYVSLECDGVDITPKLKELRVHAIVFLNIGSYGGGTKPWAKGMGTSDPSTEDSLIEVLGLTTYQLPLLQAGGHGTCITQCRTAKIVTTKTIPMQVDGEACKLKPSIIVITHLNTATMLAKKKMGRIISPQAALEHYNYAIYEIAMHDYENYHCDKEKLIETAVSIGTLEIVLTADLESARITINKLLEERNGHGLDWCFVDSCTAERFFRIDKAQENLHYVMDIAIDNLYILQCGHEIIPYDTLQDETAYPSPSSKSNLMIPDNMRSSNEGSLDSPSDHPSLLSNQIIEQVDTMNSSQMKSTTVSSNKGNESGEELIAAAKAGNFLRLKELHSHGISLMLHDTTGQTALHYAARYGHNDIIRYILFQNAEFIDKKDTIYGQTALHKAAAYGWHDICSMLVARGAAIDIQDHKGNTSIMLALQNDDIDLAAYLSGQQSF